MVGCGNTSYELIVEILMLMVVNLELSCSCYHCIISLVCDTALYLLIVMYMYLICDLCYICALEILEILEILAFTNRIYDILRTLYRRICRSGDMDIGTGLVVYVLNIPHGSYIGIFSSVGLYGGYAIT